MGNLSAMLGVLREIQRLLQDHCHLLDQILNQLHEINAELKGNATRH
jgi:hypothetical protein